MGSPKNNRSNGRARSRFESNLLSGLLSKAGKSSEFAASSKAKDDASQAPPILPVKSSRYTDAKGAAEYLGISKSTFFRLRNKGFFTPSPVTGRYHLDELDREAKGVPPNHTGKGAAEVLTQKLLDIPIHDSAGSRRKHAHSVSLE